MNKRLLFLIVLHVFCFNALKSQNVPQAINYQTVVRNTVTGAPIADTPVTLLFQIADNGTIVYSEKQIDTTNSLGLINLVIGQGFVQEGAFQTINWGSGPKMLTISIESAPNNFEFLGNMQLVSVPYALYAAESDKASPTGPAAGDLAGTYPDPVIREGAVTADKIANEAVSGEKIAHMNASMGQILQWNGVWMPVSLPVDADSDPINELQNWSTLPGIPAEFADGTDNVNDADSDPTNELQNWNNLPGIPPGFADGTDNVNDGDNDPTNELQNWNNLPGIPAGFADGTDNVEDADADLSNEGRLEVLAGSSTTSIIASNTNGSMPIMIEAGIGLGISETNSKITLVNLGDNLASDDVLTSTLHDGDVSGVYDNLQIKANAVGSSEIENGAVSNTELADGAVTAVKLSNMGAADGKVLKFTNGAWAPADDLTGVAGPVYTAGAGINIAANQISATDNSASNEGSLSVGTGNASSSVISSNTSGSASVTLIAGAGLGISESGTSITLTNTATGGNGYTDCGRATTPDGQDKIMVSNDVNLCPSDAQLGLNTTLSKGMDIQVNGNGDVLGMRLEAKGGSNSNDGVLLLARSISNGSNGLKIASGSDNPGSFADITGLYVAGGGAESDIQDDGNDIGQNYGMYINLMDRVSNNDNNPPFDLYKTKDIGLYIKTPNNGYDYAAYFDGPIYTTGGFKSESNVFAQYLYAQNDIYAYNNINSKDAYVDDDFYIRNPTDFNQTWRFDVNNGPLRLSYGNFFGQSQVGVFAVNGQYTASDRMLKEDILLMPEVIADLMKLSPVSYKYISDPDKKKTIGFIAQEVEKVFPEITLLTKDDDQKDLLMLNYAGFSVIAIKAIQEQQKIIETQQAKIITQDARLDALEKEMAEMKAMWKANMVAKSGNE